MAVSVLDIHNAAIKLESVIIKTPMLHAPLLSHNLGCDLFLKLECQQYTSSFKVRGAYVAMRDLCNESERKGIITMSAGNHAQAVAYHAQKLGLPAVIVMPEQTPFSKVSQTKSYGAEIILEGRNLSECEAVVKKLIRLRGLSLIHPYDDQRVIAGQGTIGLEILEQCPDLDFILVPVGGGGLISGIATMVKSFRKDIKIIGIQTEAYPSMKASLEGSGVMCGGETLAEGIAVKRPGLLTKPIIRKFVDDILLVGESDLEKSVVALVEQQRIVSEGAGAAGIAAVLAYPELFRGKKVGTIICGGNINSRLLASILSRNMAADAV